MMSEKKFRVLSLLQDLFDAGTRASQAKKIASHIRKETASYAPDFSLEENLGYLELMGDNREACCEKFGIMLQVVVWLSSRSFLENNYFRFLNLVEKSSLSLKDRYFSQGMICYKVGDFISAEECFLKLKEVKDGLDFHQTGAMSYRSKVSLAELKEPEPNIHALVESYLVDPKGVFLVSCDIGYLFSYWEHLYRSSFLFPGEAIHVNVVFEKSEGVELAKERVFNVVNSKSFPRNVAITIEICGEDGALKTYSSISRYLLLPFAFDKYACPVAVVDIDLDFERLDADMVRGFFDKNSGYLRLRDAQFPWHRILAGFNIFPNSFQSAMFSKYLGCFLWDMYKKGYDGWMLDQMGLYIIYRDFFETSQQANPFLPASKGGNIFGVTQVANREKFRKIAKSHSK